MTRLSACMVLLGAIVMLPASTAHAQTPNPPPPTFRIYGFAQADVIEDFQRNNPDWFDVARPGRLPNAPGQFGQDGHFYMTARQSRFGFEANTPASTGDLKVVLEFDLFGVGADAGQTALRLRHAYGQWKRVGAGQTSSQFMDTDVFPNTLYYWAPNGMILSRIPQVFWQPYVAGRSNVTIGIEKPGANGDSGSYADSIELQNITPRFPMPDITGHVRCAHGWGYIQAGGVLRYVGYDDNSVAPVNDLSGHVWGGGFSLSANVKPTKTDTLRLQTTFGKGIENYFNDAPIDVAVKTTTDPTRPFVGEALPVVTVVAYLDHAWSPKWTTSAGFSSVDVTNSNGQSPNAFHMGQYASVNLLCTPVKNVVAGGEFQWARRQNNSDGFSFNDYRFAFSFKYIFEHRMTP